MWQSAEMDAIGGVDTGDRFAELRELFLGRRRKLEKLGARTTRKKSTGLSDAT